VTSCLPTLWAEAHPTMIRIMQLGRSYSRRLKSVKYDINELYPSARHAYNTIGPAVKTSRPLIQLSVFSCRFSVLVNLKLGISPEGMPYDKPQTGGKDT